MLYGVDGCMRNGDRKASCRCELLMMMMMQVITCAVEPMVVREDECGKIGEW